MLFFLISFPVIVLPVTACWWWLTIIKPLRRFNNAHDDFLLGPALTLACILIGFFKSGSLLIVIFPWFTVLTIPGLIVSVFKHADLLAVPLLSASLILLISYAGFRRIISTRRFAVIPAVVFAALTLPIGVEFKVAKMVRAQFLQQGGTCMARLHIVSSLRLASQEFPRSFHGVAMIDGMVHAWSFKEGLFFLVDPTVEVHGRELMARCA